MLRLENCRCAVSQSVSGDPPYAVRSSVKTEMLLLHPSALESGRNTPAALSDFRRKGLAEFRRPKTTEGNQSVFSGGVYVGKHSYQATSVRAPASARSSLYPLEKMPAFLRSVSKLFDLSLIHI